VWDVYDPNSLKGATREKRGTAIRRRVEGALNVPSDWQSFLPFNENKTELFHMLAEEVTNVYFPGKEVYSTYDKHVHSSPLQEDRSLIEPCNMRKLILHLLDAANNGHKDVMVRTSNTDVVVLILSKLHSLPINEVWISFGVGKHHRYIPSHNIAATLGPSKSSALAMFHSFTEVIQPLFLQERETRQHGIPGLFTQKSLMHSTYSQMPHQAFMTMPLTFWRNLLF